LREKKEVSAQSLPALGRSLRFFPISLRLCAFARQTTKKFTHSLPSVWRLLVFLRKKKLARKDAKTQRVFPCTPKIKFTKSLPASGRSLRFSLISLRLCAFARQKTNNLHQAAKGFSNFFASVRSSGQVFPALREKKEVSAQRREDAKGFSLHSKN
jgi:hypothetical protein